VQFRVLGPVDVIDNGRTVALGGKQQRRLLAVLVASCGRVVPVDRLVEVLWPGEDGPLDAVATLHTYIARLRRALGDRAVRRLEPGYQLDVASDASTPMTSSGCWPQLGLSRVAEQSRCTSVRCASGGATRTLTSSRSGGRERR